MIPRLARALPLLFGAAACQLTSPELEPVSPVAEPEQGRAVARVEADGVVLTLKNGTWPGDVLVQEEVTPIRAVIDNGSDQHLRINYSSFRLTGSSGEAYFAIPPFEVDGTVGVLLRDYDPMDSLYEQRYFRVPSTYGPVFPGLDAWSGPALAEPWFYETYASWGRTDLPTPDMLARAMPEGVLAPNGWVEGYLYFERVDDDEERVLFEVTLTDAMTGEFVTRLTAPFKVVD